MIFYFMIFGEAFLDTSTILTNPFSHHPIIQGQGPKIEVASGGSKTNDRASESDSFAHKPVTDRSISGISWCSHDWS
jgi:hypothetical protein